MIEMTLSSRHRIRNSRARYLSVTEAPHNTDFHTWMGKKHFCLFETADTGNRTPKSGWKAAWSWRFQPQIVLDQNREDFPLGGHILASINQVDETLVIFIENSNISPTV